MIFEYGQVKITNGVPIKIGDGASLFPEYKNLYWQAPGYVYPWAWANQIPWIEVFNDNGNVQIWSHKLPNDMAWKEAARDKTSYTAYYPYVGYDLYFSGPNSGNRQADANRTFLKINTVVDIAKTLFKRFGVLDGITEAALSENVLSPVTLASEAIYTDNGRPVPGGAAIKYLKLINQKGSIKINWQVYALWYYGQWTPNYPGNVLPPASFTTNLNNVSYIFQTGTGKTPGVNPNADLGKSYPCPFTLFGSWALYAFAGQIGDLQGTLEKSGTDTTQAKDLGEKYYSKDGDTITQGGKTPTPTTTPTPSAPPTPTLTPSAPPTPTLTPSAPPTPTLTPSAPPITTTGTQTAPPSTGPGPGSPSAPQPGQINPNSALPQFPVPPENLPPPGSPINNPSPLLSDTGSGVGQPKPTLEKTENANTTLIQKPDGSFVRGTTTETQGNTPLSTDNTTHSTIPGGGDGAPFVTPTATGTGTMGMLSGSTPSGKSESGNFLYPIGSKSWGKHFDAGLRPTRVIRPASPIGSPLAMKHWEAPVKIPWFGGR